MKNSLLAATISLSALPLSAHFAGSEEQANPFLSGNLYSRFSFSYQHADDYYSGGNSAATDIFENRDGEYTFLNYSLDFVYIMPNGFYVGSGVYATDAEVETDGSLNAPDTNSGIQVREIPLALGYETRFDDWRVRFEARYIFNVDQDFDRSFGSAISNAVILPTTDGSDSLALSLRGKRNFWGLEHSLTLGYQFYENDVSHPLFPEFSLGDRFFVDYELAKVWGDFKFSAGHLFSTSEDTEGDPGALGAVYLTEEPRYSELRLTGTYRITSNLLADVGIKYYYDGKDAPKQETAYFGIGYIF